jgi:antitoxin ParD1/3/4
MRPEYSALPINNCYLTYMPTSVALGDHFEEFIRKQLESGRFNNVSEVVRAGLRLLEDEQKLREIRHRELKAAIREGIDSEDAGSVEQVVARNRARRRKSAISKK